LTEPVAENVFVKSGKKKSGKAKRSTSTKRVLTTKLQHSSATKSATRASPNVPIDPSKVERFFALRQEKMQRKESEIRTRLLREELKFRNCKQGRFNEESRRRARSLDPEEQSKPRAKGEQVEQSQTPTAAPVHSGVAPPGLSERELFVWKKENNILEQQLIYLELKRSTMDDLALEYARVHGVTTWLKRAWQDHQFTQDRIKRYVSELQTTKPPDMQKWIDRQHGRMEIVTKWGDRLNELSALHLKDRGHLNAENASDF
jgi:hypothetical protein